MCTVQCTECISGFSGREGKGVISDTFYFSFSFYFFYFLGGSRCIVIPPCYSEGLIGTKIPLTTVNLTLLYVVGRRGGVPGLWDLGAWRRSALFSLRAWGRLKNIGIGV